MSNTGILHAGMKPKHKTFTSTSGDLKGSKEKILSIWREVQCHNFGYDNAVLIESINRKPHFCLLRLREQLNRLQAIFPKVQAQRLASLCSWRFKALTGNNRSRRSFTSKILHHFPLPSEYYLRNLNSVSSLSSAAFQSSSFCPMTKFVLWVNLLPPQAKNWYGISSMGLLWLS